MYLPSDVSEFQFIISATIMFVIGLVIIGAVLIAIILSGGEP